MSVRSFNRDNFYEICDELGKKDESLGTIIKDHGYPPMWSRPNSFPSLIHIILEQQVSLASALSAFNKLSSRLGRITPEGLLSLTDDEMRACYFSRQKTIYARELANAIASNKLDLESLASLPDDEIRFQLKSLKGIGDWTVDIYLLFALQRSDLFPTGDLAMMKAFRKVKNLSNEISRDQIVQMAEHWRPYRSVGTMVLWHYYLENLVAKR